MKNDTSFAMPSTRRKCYVCRRVKVARRFGEGALVEVCNMCSKDKVRASCRETKAHLDFPLRGAVCRKCRFPDDVDDNDALTSETSSVILHSSS
jgi:hypothetical protein